MERNPADPDADVVRPRNENGTAIYPFIILAVVVIVAVIGIFTTM